jgi:predicted RNA binding protein YcfA (HicA-like mRNA interferase family)
MAFSGPVWDQLKGLTAGDLAKALTRDNWTVDTKGGSQHIFRSPTHPPRRVSVHIHAKKTYGPKMLRGLLDDTGWTEDDLRRLKLVR